MGINGTPQLLNLVTFQRMYAVVSILFISLVNLVLAKEKICCATYALKYSFYFKSLTLASYSHLKKVPPQLRLNEVVTLLLLISVRTSAIIFLWLLLLLLSLLNDIHA